MTRTVDLALSLAGLPILQALPAVTAALDAGRAVVLQAAPGAGKTTGVPLALIDAPWRNGGRILMLEPRRLATRAAARRLAGLLGQAVGQRVGYRMRGDSRVGRDTVIEVLTDGVFTRMIQEDPGLDGVAAVLFDEFHERRLESDLGLALTLEARQTLRPDLRIVAMSATLQAGPLAALLDDAAVVETAGRTYPVTVHQLGAPAPSRLLPALVETVRRALETAPGGILVFLPGTSEIRRVQRLLCQDLPADCDLHPLYGDLGAAEQDRALRPAAGGRRKIVLATSIAETSLTIDGIAQVVDSGLSRIGRYDPRSGMMRLETVPVSRAGADQRAGRAGRTGPGIAWRLWDEPQHRLRPAQPAPEIATADLAPLALDLALWGNRDPASLALLDPPPAAAFAAARALLTDLGALDRLGAITAHGRRMAGFPLHPRLAHMVLRAADRGEAPLACLIAAILGEREVASAVRDSDLRTHVDLMLGPTTDLTARVRQTAGRLQRLVGGVIRQSAAVSSTSTGMLLALAYPDRIAQRRPGGPARFRLSGGQGAVLPDGDPLGAHGFLSVADLDGQKPESRIWLAAPILQAEIEDVLADRVETMDEVSFDRPSQGVQAMSRRRLGRLILHEAPLARPDPKAVARALLAGIRDAGVAGLPWSPAAQALRARLGFLGRLQPDGGWPQVDDAALDRDLETWLGPLVAGRRRIADLAALDLGAGLLDRLGWEQRSLLDRLAPTHLVAPTGSRLPIDYATEVPSVEVRVQELFGLTLHPTVADGRVRLLLHLLSPARRPIQLTADLPGFWSGSWKAVRAELRGRYPRHPWPEDPAAALPTTRAKPRGT